LIFYDGGDCVAINLNPYQGLKQNDTSNYNPDKFDYSCNQPKSLSGIETKTD